MRVKAQFSMTFNLEKCIGCNTCTVACKNVWTNREGAEYMWWNNVETKPGIGYPKEWENQVKYRGGWTRREGANAPKLRNASRFWQMVNLFYNPVMPQMTEYYGPGPYTFTYGDFHSTKQLAQQPVARPQSMITGQEDIALTWGVNWEDNAGGAHITGKRDVNFQEMSKEEHEACLRLRDVFYFYLPRICNHCLNPGCVAACPSGAAYKREEDGIVLIDQNRCRAWRYCITSCPYKKVYLNWRTGKMEKCILCYPRLETGQAPVCFHSCVGRIRSVGPLLYDLDRVAAAANVPDSELVQAQRDVILDPNDPQVIEAARKAGINESWLEACRRSPVYKLVKQWRLALPLHAEFRTVPMLFYIPPLSPLITSAGKDSPGDTDVFDMAKTDGMLADLHELDKMRVPLKYLARMLGAGNVEVVKESLLRQLAVRHYERSLRVDGKPNVEVLKKVGLTEADAKGIVRGLSLAFYHERFVVPTTHYEATANAPYIERGFAGFGEMAPGFQPQRRQRFHSPMPEVGS